MADTQKPAKGLQKARQTKKADTKPRRKGGRPRKARGASTSADGGGSRWTVRGIPKPVRDIAVREAEIQGKTVGDWLAETIVKVSRSAENGVSADVPGPTLQDTVKALNERLTKIETDRSKGFLGRLFGRQP